MKILLYEEQPHTKETQRSLLIFTQSKSTDRIYMCLDIEERDCDKLRNFYAMNLTETGEDSAGKLTLTGDGNRTGGAPAGELTQLQPKKR